MLYRNTPKSDLQKAACVDGKYSRPAHVFGNGEAELGISLYP